MTEAERLFGDAHVRRYRETGGQVGHVWKEGSTILLLTTTDRRSGRPRTTPLIYARDGDRYVIVASKGGAPEHPGWYRNLQKHPDVELQVLAEVFPARARTAEGEERATHTVRRRIHSGSGGATRYQGEGTMKICGNVYMPRSVFSASLRVASRTATATRCR